MFYWALKVVYVTTYMILIMLTDNCFITELQFKNGNALIKLSINKYNHNLLINER